ncbi:hypothetical protein chiPu_0001008 [Chiloscyllium punctatum]|uniref:Uncharacterized protein n=1 Tax=Chiloscyllium punctatum TaxID=137246 RepID=A0A401RWT6_CHIPU|nr:hypothetical protein [Chiloscyllium punctatum]
MFAYSINRIKQFKTRTSQRLAGTRKVEPEIAARTKSGVTGGSAFSLRKATGSPGLESRSRADPKHELVVARQQQEACYCRRLGDAALSAARSQSPGV